MSGGASRDFSLGFPGGPLAGLPRAAMLLAARVVAAALVGAQAAPAQTRLASAIDVGAAHVAFADSGRLTAATLSPVFYLDAPLASLRAAATASRPDRGGWTAQGMFTGQLFSPPRGSLRFEAAGAASGTAHSDGWRTGLLLGLGRAHIARPSAGLWVGAGGGRAWDGLTGHPIAISEAGGWARAGPTALVVTVTPTWQGVSDRYVDADAAMRWTSARLEVAGTAGLRTAWTQRPQAARTIWGSLATTLWMRQRVALLAGAGTYPVNLAQGLPGGRYAFAGIRLTPHPSALRHITGAPHLRPAPPAASFEVGDADADDIRMLRLRAPAARLVEIAGDFTDWAPVALSASDGGWWELPVRIPPGLHHLNVRFDGGEWTVPPGLSVVADEFAGRVGVVIVR